MRGDGRIYHRGDALWISYYAGGDRRESVATLCGKTALQTTWDDAVKVLKRRREQKIVARARGSILSAAEERVTVETLCRDYLAQRLASGIKRPRAFAREIERTIHIWGKQRASRITREGLWHDVHRLRDAGLKRASVKTYLATLHAVLVAAGERVPRLPKFPELGSDPLRRVVWSEAELERCCAAAEPWLADVLRFGYATGWRCSEVLGLTWDRVRDGMIYLDESKTGEGRVRPIDLPHFDLTAVIESRRAQRRLGCPWVFHWDGHAVNPAYFYTKMDRAREASGVGDRIFHDFRRGVAERALLHGADLFVTQELLGHRALSSTRRYTRHSVERMRKQLGGGR